MRQMKSNYILVCAYLLICQFCPTGNAVIETNSSDQLKKVLHQLLFALITHCYFFLHDYRTNIPGFRHHLLLCFEWLIKITEVALCICLMSRFLRILCILI